MEDTQQQKDELYMRKALAEAESRITPVKYR